MAEVQSSTNSGEMAQRFIEFVMMQAQNAALFLGQIPNPRGEQPEVNLELSKLFIDQLVMIRGKTKGNLSNDEMGVLNNAISNLQITFYEVSQKLKAGDQSGAPESAPPVDSAGGSEAAPAPAIETGAAPAADEGRKKFSKSYGN